MPGFTAGNAQGELVCLGRNGSDYSAAVLAACLRADCCEIWTDVDGVYNCDPRLVDDARLLKSLSYQEAMELSYFGASVLHRKTISPFAQFQIPCLIKNSLFFLARILDSPAMEMASKMVALFFIITIGPPPLNSPIAVKRIPPILSFTKTSSLK
jgi:uridylate kinase